MSAATRRYETIAVRLDAAMVKDLDKHLERMQKSAAAGVELSRSDALRNLLSLGLSLGLYPGRPSAR